MLRYAFLVFVASAGALLESPLTSKIYRDDYSYSPQTQAFFKFHPESATYTKASKMCGLEGAKLMVPASIQDITEVHALFKQFPDIGNYVWVGDDGEVHESAEDEAIIKFSSEEEGVEEGAMKAEAPCLVLTREGQIEDHACESYNGNIELPFVCKVEADKAPYSSQCDVYSNEYVYKENVGSCYRVSKASCTWEEAYALCNHERAHLVVVNSEAERVVVKQLMTANPLLRDSHSPYYYIAGIRAEPVVGNAPRVFRTIFNQTLEEAGFAEWADTEPNNLDGNENCGSVYETDGKYNDHTCVYPFGFICEKEKAKEPPAL